MKILLVAPQPFYTERGTPIAVRLLAESLCGAGHSVDLLVYHEGQDISMPGLRLIRAGRPPGVRHVPIGISVAKLICDLWLIAAMIRCLRRERYDVVHAVEEAVFPAAAWCAVSGVRLVYDMDSSLADQVVDKWWLLKPLGALLRLFERFAVRHASVTLAVCEDLAVKVRPWVGSNRVWVLPDVPVGGDASAAAAERLRAQVGDDGVLALYVGNLENYQGIDLLLQGLARMPATTPLKTVVIGGSNEHIEHYRRLAGQLGIGARIWFLGPRPVAQLPAYLEQADILLSPRTLGQNTPMKVYSYMAAGKAILATGIRSHLQVLDETTAAIVSLEAQSMADALARLAGDAALRQQLGAAARTKVETEYSLERYRQILGDAYRQLAAD